ncbi:transposase [Streptomyces sp. NPDC005507]|uniref:transposase n=1 Tax=Streptomyces sp. NPDC005507 TaxID=3154885 RepID=UPI0033AC04AA
MRNTRIWTRLRDVENTVIEQVEAVEGESDGEDVEGAGEIEIVVSARPAKGQRQRCGICGQRAARYDAGEGRRRWRALDIGTIKAFIEADAPRVRCTEHGVTVARVPWARHGAGHTNAFDQTAAWLATCCSKTTVTQLLRCGWRTVGNIVQRVWRDIEQGVDLFAGLRRIGIDEISYKKRHKYLTIVVDHDSGRLVWAAAGRDKNTLHAFFDALGAERAAKITHVSADGAEWIDSVVAERCPCLFKTELIKPRRPWKTLSEVELATAEWVDWYCHRRLHGEIGHTPPVEYETNYYSETTKPQVTVKI